MGISLPRPVSNSGSCLISQLGFLTPTLDQQRSFAYWAASSLGKPVIGFLRWLKHEPSSVRCPNSVP
jgi:hypothetical protein